MHPGPTPRWVVPVRRRLSLRRLRLPEARDRFRRPVRPTLDGFRLNTPRRSDCSDRLRQSRGWRDGSGFGCAPGRASTRCLRPCGRTRRAHPAWSAWRCKTDKWVLELTPRRRCRPALTELTRCPRKSLRSGRHVLARPEARPRSKKRLRLLAPPRYQRLGYSR